MNEDKSSNLGISWTCLEQKLKVHMELIKYKITLYIGSYSIGLLSGMTLQKYTFGQRW